MLWKRARRLSPAAPPDAEGMTKPSLERRATGTPFTASTLALGQREFAAPAKVHVPRRTDVLRVGGSEVLRMGVV